MLRTYSTADNAADASPVEFSPMQVLTTDEISPRQHLTPEGFLLCLAVPVARVGEMLYVPGEVPVEPGKDGLCRVARTAEHLFADDAIQSLLGKDVIDEHPPAGTLVTPANRQQLTRGTVMNPRRGTGDNADAILCDLLIMDKDLIRKRQEGKVEVSAGYEADYDDNGASCVGNAGRFRVGVHP